MTSTDTDDELILRCLSGNTKSFVELVQRYDRSMRSIAYAAIGNSPDFEDVIQNSLINAFRNLDSFQLQTNFQSWLIRIVHNAAIDHARKIKRTEQFAETMQADFSATVVTRLDVNAALAKLSEPQRTAVMLVDGLGFDYRTAATTLDTPEGTVASRVNTARSALRKTLAEKEQ